MTNPTAAAIKFSIPGFMTMDDIATLDEILTENVARIRKIDPAGRTASDEEG